MSGGIPVLLRAALLLERLAASGYRRSAALTRRVALTRVEPARRPDVTAAIYSSQTSFAPGGGQFTAGLFAWERVALEHPCFPRRGKLLVGGAGGGREVVALASSGFAVVGFEPSERLVRLGRAATSGLDRCELLAGSYEALVAEVRGARGGLARVVEAAPFDGVILGWGSLSHILDPGERAALLQAVRTLAPAAPVFLTYMRHAAVESTRAAATLAGPAAEEGPVGFAAHTGYYRTLSEPQVAALANGAGYEVVLSQAAPYPHALLVPRPTGEAIGSPAPTPDPNRPRPSML